MQYANQTIDELVRTAEHENNVLALAIVDAEPEEDGNQFDQLIDDVIDHQVAEIDEKLSSYINDYYLNPESDYYDFLFDFAADHIETDQLQAYIDENELDIDIDLVTDRLASMADYYCEVEICHNYSASRGIAIQGACIGEIEEQIDMINDMIDMQFSDTETADKIHKGILQSLSTVHVNENSDYVYIDMSDTFASLVVKADMIDELFAPED